MNKALGLALFGGAIFAAYKYHLFGAASSNPAAPAGSASAPAPPVVDHTPPVAAPPPAPAGVADLVAACLAAGHNWGPNGCITVAPPAPGGFFTPAASSAASQSNTLLQQLQAASDALGDHQIQRSVDTWNYLLGKIKPGVTVDDLSEVGIIRGTNDLMLAESYLAYRAQAGLSGYAAAYGVPLKRRGPQTMFYATRRNYVRRSA